MSKNIKKPSVLISKYTISCETRDDFEYYYNGPKYHGALWDLSQELRKERKYGRHFMLFSKLEARFYKILEENGVEL